MPWTRFVVLRLLGVVGTLAGLSILIFAATEVLPGDAAGVIAGPGGSAQQLAEVRTQLGLDQSPVRRYAEWTAGIVRGDLGTAYLGGRDVAEVLAGRLPASLLLLALVYLVAIPCGLLLGVVTGFASVRRRNGAADRIVSTALLIALGTPEFVLAGLLALAAVASGVVPAVSVLPPGSTPLDAPETLVLPVASLAVVATAVVARLSRASVADVLATPYIESARLAGVSGWGLVTRHVLPNALGPTIQAVALSAGGLLGAAVVVESIFEYPGIGRTLHEAVLARDIPVVQGAALTLCAITLIALLAGDLATRLLTPGQRPATRAADS